MLGKAVNTCCSQDGFPTIYGTILSSRGNKKNSTTARSSSGTYLFKGFNKKQISKDVLTPTTFNATKQGSAIPKKRAMVAMNATTTMNVMKAEKAKVAKTPAALVSKTMLEVATCPRILSYTSATHVYCRILSYTSVAHAVVFFDADAHHAMPRTPV